MAYETMIKIDRFKGINQSSNVDNLPLHYALYAENCDTSGGDLKPMRSGRAIQATALPAPIKTLARLYRRNHAIVEDREIMVAVAGGKLYTKTLNARSWTLRYTGIINDDFDYVTYETNVSTSEFSIDILLMSNVNDGMLCLYGNDLSVKRVSTPSKFGVIGRYAERIWGGAIKDRPDTLVYSRPFDPFNWTQDNEHPEDGAGEVSNPSWDGDKFIAIRAYGSQLLAFKRNRVWRILGTNPGNYVFKEQYGGGAIVENTVIQRDTYVFMLSYWGIMAYDGTAVSPFRQEEIQGIWARVNKDNLHKACAISFDNKMYFAVPIDDASDNNAIIIFNFDDNSFMLRTQTYVSSFMEYEDDLYYTTSGADKGKVWLMDGGTPLPLRWESAFQDLGAKNIVKSGFELYLGVDAPIGTVIKLSLATEKKEKVKDYIVTNNRIKRMRISNSGRRFKLAINSNSNVMWRMQSGVQIQLELDED